MSITNKHSWVLYVLLLVLYSIAKWFNGWKVLSLQHLQGSSLKPYFLLTTDKVVPGGKGPRYCNNGHLPSWLGCALFRVFREQIPSFGTILRASTVLLR